MATGRLYADSFSGIQSARLADAEARRAAFNRALQLFTNQRQQQFQNRAYQQRQAEAAQQQALENEYNNRVFNANEQQRNVQNELERGRLLQGELNRKAEIDYRNRALGLKETNDPVLERQLFMTALEEAETTGMPVAQKYGLRPELAAIADEAAIRARPYLLAEQEKAREVAQTLNRPEMLRQFGERTKKSMALAPRARLFNPWSWYKAFQPSGPVDAERRRLAMIEGELPNATRAAGLVRGDRSTMDMVAPGAGGYYRSALPPLGFVPQRRGIAYVDPAVAPAGPVMPATDVSVSSTNVAPNPYIPGRRYGNLRYVGGDPLDERSWVPVTAVQ